MFRDELADNIYVKIHFNECCDESIYISLAEAEEWLDEIRSIADDASLLPEVRLQKIVDDIIGTC